MNTISPEKALELINTENAILIDVRSPAEFEQEHIAAAQSLPLDDIERHMKQLSLSEEKIVILQCQKGLRGEQARARLIKGASNPTQFFNLEGGIDAWKNANLPVISADGKPAGIPMPRQIQITSGLMILAFSLSYLSGANWAIYVLIVMGVMMIFSGASGWCGMVKLLLKMPWNRP